LFNRASIICKEKFGFINEINNIRHDFAPSGYPQHFIYSVLNRSRTKRLATEGTQYNTVVIPYTEVILETFRCIWNKYNIRRGFETNYVLHNSLADQDTRHETLVSVAFPANVANRSLRISLEEHNLKQNLMEKPTLVNMHIVACILVTRQVINGFWIR
jgi:hypothetical protein